MQPADLALLQRMRSAIEAGLRARFGPTPRFYYGGSYGKGTMLRSSFDLDLVVSFAPTENVALGPHMNLAGHFWTIAPGLVGEIWPPRAPVATHWTTTLFDPDVGEVRLGGRLRTIPGTNSLLIVVHGLGGSTERPYCLRAARAAEQAGWSCLRLALRGADGSGEDFYHAGLTADLEAALASQDLTHFGSIAILGYSLGAHVVLRYATGRTDPRVRAAAAICPPLDLAATAHHLDTAAPAFYRHRILRSLVETYAAVAARRQVPTPVERLRQVRTIQEFDSLTVVPRFGFRDVDDYYSTQAVGGRLDRIGIPTLILAARRDPMVPATSIERGLIGASAGVDVRWIDRGGHVGFPPRSRLGSAGPFGLEHQILAWFGRDAR